MSEKPKPRKHYVDNQKFFQAIVEHKVKCKVAIDAGKQTPKPSNYIGDCVLKIAQNLAMHPKFYNYSFRDEMISDAMENCFLYFNNFNPEKTQNPFAYFTQIIYHSFVRRIMKERKQTYIKYRAIENAGIFDGGDSGGDDGEKNGLQGSPLYDNMSEFISNFEESRRKKQEKKRAGQTKKKAEKVSTDGSIIE